MSVGALLAGESRASSLREGARSPESDAGTARSVLHAAPMSGVASVRGSFAGTLSNGGATVLPLESLVCGVASERGAEAAFSLGLEGLGCDTGVPLASTVKEASLSFESVPGNLDFVEAAAVRLVASLEGFGSPVESGVVGGCVTGGTEDVLIFEVTLREGFGSPVRSATVGGLVTVGAGDVLLFDEVPDALTLAGGSVGFARAAGASLWLATALLEAAGTSLLLATALLKVVAAGTSLLLATALLTEVALATADASLLMATALLAAAGVSLLLAAALLKEVALAAAMMTSGAIG